MIPRRCRSITEVAERQLCLGCGACVYGQPDVLEMRNVVDHGLRPFIREGVSAGDDTSAALALCPGADLLAPARHERRGYPGLRQGWGVVLELWEGHAADPDVRFRGSSGGAATALAAWALRERGWSGVLHIKAREDRPYLNETTLSTTPSELLAATGSRYAPASPCDRLDLVEGADGPCVFIGKPCDVAAVSKARARSTALDTNLGLTIAIFCAGTPSTQATLEMLDAMGVDDLSQLRDVRYRGNGWPGEATAQSVDSSGRLAESRLSYEQSWGEILQRHRPWRCHICPDHTGEFADVAVGDPWYREIPEGEPGRSLLLARTERGRQFIEGAIAAGAVVADRADPWVLEASQPNLLRARAATWGRVHASGALGAAVPRYRGFHLLRLWLRELGLFDKVRSLTGTARRVLRRRLYRRVGMRPDPTDER